MLNTFKDKFNNTSFYNKIFILCLSVSIIPVLVLGIFSQSLMSQTLINRENTTLDTTLKHELLSLEFKLNTYLQLMNFIMLDTHIEEALTKDYNDNYEMYITYRDIIVPTIDNVKFIQDPINFVTIYTNSNIYSQSSYLSTLEELENKIWYTNSNHFYTPEFYVDHVNKTVELICQNYNQFSNYKYYVVMNIDYDDLFNVFETTFNSYFGIQILDQTNKTTIFEYNDLDNKVKIDINNFDITEYVISKSNITNTNWNAYLYRPIDKIVHDSRLVTLPMMLVLYFCIIIIFPVSRQFAKKLVKPIKNLQENMTLVESSSDFTLTKQYNSKDEIGQLYASFNTMLDKTNYLVNEVLKSKIMQQEYEMKALQAQINPHFLYNSLALIHNKAIIENQSHISKIANQLSLFYRTTLNKGNSITTLKAELDNVKAYINIQLIMHDYSFDVIYDLDESLYNYNMPNLTCQPLIENAIEHGIDHSLSDDKSVLSISCFLENDLIVIKIMDNGCGMSKEKCDSILTAESDGYGIQNVNHRIQLIYGENFGLNYTSTKGFGTCVKISFPITIPNK